ncbi:MAG TPA: hypothetical protein VGS41_17010, partial [Chthonomonadales bacterium]|nr:hypothetical protein [Chthonomonadales bacterium]
MRVQLGLAAALGLFAWCAAAKPATAQDQTYTNTGWNDSARNEPAPMRYPVAPPGGLQLYHWEDYTHSDLMPGSVQDVRWHRNLEAAQNEMMFDKARSRDHYWEWPYTAAPITYPMASPGGLNLYHWRDYRHFDLAPGSATDARWR